MKNVFPMWEYAQSPFTATCHAPAEGSITIFPIPCRDRVIKTALCLSEDFEGSWIRQCIEGGLRVYMKKEAPMFTGKEPAAYRKKILSYYQDVKSYGICFVEDEDSCNQHFKSVRAEVKPQSKARFTPCRTCGMFRRAENFRFMPEMF